MRNFAQIQKLSPLAMLGSGFARPKGAVRWAFDDMAEQERPTLLRECLARAGVHYEFHAVGDVPFHVDLAMTAFPGLMVVMGGLHASRRCGARELAAETRDDATLLLNLKGTHRIEQKGHDLVLGEGEAAFTSCSDPSIMTHGGASHMLGLRFPKAGLAPLVDGLSDRLVRRIPGDLPALRLLRSYLAVAWEHGHAGAELQCSLVSHVYDLMAVMVGPTRDTAAVAEARGLAAARLHTIKEDIERNLAEPHLSVAVLAVRHGCTARSVQRLFEQEGTTFTEYLLAQRLAHAHRLLGDPDRQDDKISAVAFDCGFGDLSYFNRVFRRRYGAAPSEVRAQARRDASPSSRHDH
jgi:AraC-like DNA-binding protein